MEGCVRQLWTGLQKHVAGLNMCLHLPQGSVSQNMRVLWTTGHRRFSVCLIVSVCISVRLSACLPVCLSVSAPVPVQHYSTYSIIAICMDRNGRATSGGAPPAQRPPASGAVAPNTAASKIATASASRLLFARASVSGAGLSPASPALALPWRWHCPGAVLALSWHFGTVLALSLRCPGTVLALSRTCVPDGADWITAAAQLLRRRPRGQGHALGVQYLVLPPRPSYPVNTEHGEYKCAYVSVCILLPRY